MAFVSQEAMLFALLALLGFAAPGQDATPRIDPPPVNEAALAVSVGGATGSEA